jgi:hypothetical protein
MKEKYYESSPSWESPLAQLGQSAWALLSSFQDLRGRALKSDETDYLGEAAVDHAILLRKLALSDTTKDEWTTTSPECRAIVSAASGYLLTYAPWQDADVEYLASLRQPHYPPGPEGNTTPNLAESIAGHPGLIDGYSDWLGVGAAGDNVPSRLEVQGAFVTAIAKVLNQYIPEH